MMSHPDSQQFCDSEVAKGCLETGLDWPGHLFGVDGRVSFVVGVLVLEARVDSVSQNVLPALRVR